LSRIQQKCFLFQNFNPFTLKANKKEKYY